MRFTRILEVACIASACAPAPAEAPRAERGRVAINETCTSCHVKETTEWSTSLHRGSYTNTAFQTALAVEPTAFCRGCHAPEADPRTPPERASAEMGVGCVTCHVTANQGPHDTKRTDDTCAGCHEFGFPSARSDDDGDFMQTTVREHRRSSAAAQPCVTCHMPEVNGRRSHAFADVRDPTWLAEHLDVKAEIVSGRVRVTLAQRGGGPAFPTGDLFRRLEVGAEVRGTRSVRHLARHFEIVSGRPGRRLTLDDRVFDSPVEIDLDLTPKKGDDVAWWVSLQRVAEVGTGSDPLEATIESEVKLHSGVLRTEGKR
jgi:hypothetical protein